MDFREFVELRAGSLIRFFSFRFNTKAITQLHNLLLESNFSTAPAGTTRDCRHRGSSADRFSPGVEQLVIRAPCFFFLFFSLVHFGMIKKYIARNGHRLCDMGVGTSRHVDDQLPCRRSRMRAPDDRTRFDGKGDKACGLGKQLKPKSSANFRSTSTPCACS